MTILYFAWLKEAMGRGEETMPLPDSVSTVADLIAHLKDQSPRHAGLFAPENRILTAVNQDMATPETPVRNGDEVAFFPPMTGG